MMPHHFVDIPSSRITAIRSSAAHRPGISDQISRFLPYASTRDCAQLCACSFALYDISQISLRVFASYHQSGAADWRVAVCLAPIGYKSEMPSASSSHRPLRSFSPCDSLSSHKQFYRSLKMFFKIKQALVGFLLFLIASTLALCKNSPSDGFHHITIATSAHVDRKNTVKSSSSSDTEDVSAVTITLTAAKPQQEIALRVSGTGSVIHPLHKATPFDTSQQQSSAEPVIVSYPAALASGKVNVTKTFNSINQNSRYSAAYEGHTKTSGVQIPTQVASLTHDDGISVTSSVPANTTAVASTTDIENNISAHSFPPTDRHRHECFWSVEQIADGIRQHKEAQSFLLGEAEKHGEAAERLMWMGVQRPGVGSAVMKGGEVHFEMEVRQVHQQATSRQILIQSYSIEIAVCPGPEFRSEGGMRRSMGSCDHIARVGNCSGVIGAPLSLAHVPAVLRPAGQEQQKEVSLRSTDDSVGGKSQSGSLRC
jgi:hypothetical protein